MYKTIIAVVTAMPLFLGVTACGEDEEFERAGEKIGQAVDKASDAAADAAEQAGDKIEQWTDRANSDEQDIEEHGKAADRRAAE